MNKSNIPLTANENDEIMLDVIEDTSMDHHQQEQPERPQQQNHNDIEGNLYVAVRKVLMENGEIGRLKALIQSKVLNILRGGESSAIGSKNHPHKDKRIDLLNHLILEYFYWFGFQYSAEIFGSESGINTECPPRNQLERQLGSDYCKDIPILLEIVSGVLHDNQQKQQ